MPSTQLIRVINQLSQLNSRGMRRSGDGWSCRCPAHEDKVNSLSVTEEGDRVLLHCFTGCTAEAIVGALNLTMADLFVREDASPAPLHFQPREQRRQRTVAEELVATYEYTDGFGAVLAVKGRFSLPEIGIDGKQKKTFRWRLPGSAYWTGIEPLTTADLALWGAELIAGTPRETVIFFVEGEKAALACRERGLLTVTHAGGAGVRDFGEALEVLRGRTVALWPDNDGSGRDYVAALQARLRGLAADVRVIDVPLPPKGDAYEFFDSGGTVDQLKAGAQPANEPAVHYLAPDHIAIIMPVAGIGRVSFDFDEMKAGSRALDCDLSVTIQAPGVSATPVFERVNLLSNSGKTELRRELQEIHGKSLGIPWATLLNEVFAQARLRFLSYDRTIDLFDVEPTSEADLFFHNPLLMKNAVNIMFGDREAGKSYIAYYIAYCVAMGIPFMNQDMPFGPVLVADCEDTKENLRRRINRLAGGLNSEMLPGMIHYLDLMGVPLVEMTKMLRNKIIAEGIVLVIIDSIGPATGGRPEEAERAIAFMQAARSLGTTVLAIAHVPKNHGPQQPDDAFGSIFYSNLSRRTWYVEGIQDEETSRIDVGLFPKKKNDGPKPRPISLGIEFEGLNGPVVIQRTDMGAVPELQKQRPLRWQIWDVLTEPRTIPEIVMMLPREGDDPKLLEKLKEKIDTALTGNAKMFGRAGQHPNTGTRPLTLWGRLAHA